MKSKIIFLVFAFCGLQINAQKKSLKWNLDKTNSRIGFNVEHMSIAEIDGKFADFGVNYICDSLIENAKVEIDISAKSVSTGDEERDAHIRSHDFLFCKEYPKISFVSHPKGFIKIDSNHYKLMGDLTIRNITKPIELALKVSRTIIDLWGKERIGFRVHGTIVRDLFGLRLNTILEQGVLSIGNEIEIRGSIQLSR